MDIFLIIIGSILALLCAIPAIATYSTLRSQQSWDDLVRAAEEKNLPVSEEELYKLVSKLNIWLTIGTLFGLILVTGGILIHIF